MKKNDKNVLLQDYKLSTDTTFRANGEIDINPCSWELEKGPITVDAETKFVRGRVMVHPDGHTYFKPFTKGNGNHFEDLLVLPNCIVRKSKHQVLVEYRFSKKLSPEQSYIMLKEQGDEVLDFVKDLFEW